MSETFAKTSEKAVSKADTKLLDRIACATNPQHNSRERNAVLGQSEDLVRLADHLQILRERMGNDLAPREHEHRCGDCDQIPHSTFDRIIVNNHHINCLTEFVDDLIARFQP